MSEPFCGACFIYSHIRDRHVYIQLSKIKAESCVLLCYVVFVESTSYSDLMMFKMIDDESSYKSGHTVLSARLPEGLKAFL